MRVIQATAGAGYRVRLRFNDGYEAELDLRPALAVNDPLLDPALFTTAGTNGLTLCWGEAIDFCPDALRLWCEAGKVLPPPAETQARP